jgi:hypothetical protein
MYSTFTPFQEDKMKKRGKIKFSHVKNQRGIKTDYFRVCGDQKDPQGDWMVLPGFPEQMYGMNFHFPFKKLSNNVIIGYSGYVKLPTSANRGAPLASYFIMADGIDAPMVAFPDGHNGREWDGRVHKDYTLTQERLNKWAMVKKRMTVLLVPEGFGPHEYVTWSTTSSVAMDYILADYMALSGMIGDDLALFPLKFRALAKTIKNRDGQTAKFSIGTIGFGGTPKAFAEAIQETKGLKEIINLDEFEKTFESEGVFYYGDEGSEYEEPVEYDENTGEVIPTSANNSEALGITLKGLVSNTQKDKIIALAKKHDRVAELAEILTTGDALRFMNQLMTAEAKAS